MSDGNEIDLMKAATHVATGVGSGGIIAAVMRYFQGRAAEQAREEFIMLRSDVRTLIEDVKEHKKVFEDVVETKLSVKALHARLDDTERRLERLEARKR